MPAKLTSEKRDAIIARLKRGEALRAIAVAEEVGRSSVARIKRLALPKDTTSAGEVLHVRVSRAEFEAFEALVAKAGRTKSDVLRGLIRQASGFVELDAGVVAALDQTRKALSPIGGNLNQLARAANRGRLQWRDDDRAQLDALKREIRTLLMQVHTLSEQGKRRLSA